MFDAVRNKIEFPSMEEDILRFWEEKDTFRASVDQRSGNTEYVFYDGPPFATGLPHYGHLLAGAIKDIVPRYHSMRGRYVSRRFGWDCHGLPIEALAQDALGCSGAVDIREKGVDVFNEQCRSMVLQYVEEWRRTVTRMGRWVDFDDDYKTMDKTFMETIWWVFKQLWDQGRIYKAHRIMPYSWKLTTPLSNFEAGNNYKEVQDPAITVRLKLTGELPWDMPAYALAWTTTPWTLPSNLALCAGPDISYVAVHDRSSEAVYLLAEARVDSVFKSAADISILDSFRGADLEGWAYAPLFPYFEDQPNAFRILVDGFVSTEEGTGLVHLAPGYGEDDYRVCREAGIDLVDALNEECRFTDAVPDYAGEFCKDADKAIIRRLKEEGGLVHQSTLVHGYPYCERTDTPLIYRAIEAWYVRVEDLRDRLVRHNQDVHWVPGYVGEKRFGNWLRDAKDWNISRNRFWGSCLPVWVSEDGADMICVGSIEELESLTGQTVSDLHKHVLDGLIIEKEGKIYRRTPEVLDCWFESGAMPYAQMHYPFENRERFESHFPADFIAEGLDQTRGWFYTLMVLSTALFDRPAFRNVVVNGLVLAEDGRKMSKRLKNYPDPHYILDAYGADALRLYLISSPVVRAEDLCFTEEGVKHALRHLLIPWWNAYSFFVTYARIDGWTPDERPAVRENLLDRWIGSRVEHLAMDVVAAMDQYDLQSAVRPFVQFIEDLTNWYIRRSRRRFWKSSNDADKNQAYATLYDVLLKLSKIAAPFVPFISEAIYRNLRQADQPASVHLCDFPTGEASLRDEPLEARMASAMAVVGLGRTLRTEHTLRVRQPLRALHIVSREEDRLDEVRALEDLIRDELNVKAIEYSRDEADLAHLEAKPNFKALGPRFGKQVKQVASALARQETAALERLLDEGTLDIEVEGQTVTLTSGDVVVQRSPREGLAVASSGPYVVALETELDEDLILEGLAREFVSRVQNMRKQQDLDVTQRIRVAFDGPSEMQAAVDRHRESIAGEVLALQVEGREGLGEDSTEWEVGDFRCRIAIETA